MAPERTLLRLAPPLVIDEDQADFAVRTLDGCIAEVERSYSFKAVSGTTIARLMFAIVSYRSRRGLAEAAQATPSRLRMIRGGERGARACRGETYGYWYLRRQGYVLVARNYTSPGLKGGFDMAGYDGSTLAFIEVKTRAATQQGRPTPEEAVNADKQRSARWRGSFFAHGKRTRPAAGSTCWPLKPARANRRR